MLHGRLTVGTLLLALAYLGFAHGPLSGIANTTGTIKQALASADRVRATFALATEVDDGSAPSPPLQGLVQFEHVSFAYDAEPARAACAHGVIMRLASGYDTELAEAGIGLSGGEKQRLSIARACLKNARS